MGTVVDQPSGSIGPDEAKAHRAFISVRALGKNLSAWWGRGGRRPSIWLGMKLLLRGDWRTFRRQLIINTKPVEPPLSEYQQWVHNNAITSERRDWMRGQINSWTARPKISIILPVYNVAENYLRACLDSVLKQVYRDWQLCVVDDASPLPHVREVLAEYAGKDARICVRYRENNGGISAASNTALEMADGQYIALLDHDDELAEQALFRVGEAIVRDPSVDMIYSDEDKLSLEGERVDPFFKPDWSPEYFLSCMYTCHLGVYRAELVRQIGGWRSEFDGAQDYDLVLRLLSRQPKIFHIPDVLYHWRVHPGSTALAADAKPEAHKRATVAIQCFIDGSGREGAVEDGPAAGFHSVRYKIVGRPKISIIIPSACQKVPEFGWLIARCVKSIYERSTYRNFEVLALDQHNMPAELEAELLKLGARRVSYDFEFNWSRVNNFGAEAATGDYLLFLNDDTEVITADWMERMLEYAQWPEIGVVGAKLLFADGTLQHTGVVLPGDNPTHPFLGQGNDHPGYFFSNMVHRNWTAVTGACLMTRALVFRSVGGFDASFPLNYNDVEYCIRLVDRGLRVVYVPGAELYHFESSTRESKIMDWELDAFQKMWRSKFKCDPFYNPNLTRISGDFQIDTAAKIFPEMNG